MPQNKSDILFGTTSFDERVLQQALGRCAAGPHAAGTLVNARNAAVSLLAALSGPMVCPPDVRAGAKHAIEQAAPFMALIAK